MIENIAIACDAIFGAGSENFGTITGNVTFQDGSANNGTVNGNAVFEGNAENKSGATVTGDATFAATAVNNGTVTGNVTVLGGGSGDSAPVITGGDLTRSESFYDAEYNGSGISYWFSRVHVEGTPSPDISIQMYHLGAWHNVMFTPDFYMDTNSSDEWNAVNVWDGNSKQPIRIVATNSVSTVIKDLIY